MKVLTTAAVLLILQGCSKLEEETSTSRFDDQLTTCSPLLVKQVYWTELNKRFPTVVGTRRLPKDFVDSSQFKAHCLYSENPEFADGMEYVETRVGLDGKEIHLFSPLGVTDTLIGFGPQMGGEVYVVGML